jgi:hypothetical protein
LKREDSDVVGNVLRKRRTGYGNDSNFSVTRIGGDATGESHGRYRFVNNTILSGTGAVFRCFDSLESVEMHNNAFYRFSGGVNIMRVIEANWTQDSAVICGSNNWVYQGASNIPTQWTGTILGTDPGFRDYQNADFRPASGSPLLDAANNSPQSPAGFPFPGPLFPPVYHPPMHACGPAAEARPVFGGLDIAAYEYSPTGIEENRIQAGSIQATAWPQPFRTNVIIRWTMDEGRKTRNEALRIFDSCGSLVRSFTISSLALHPTSFVIWDGLDQRGKKVSAGVYWVMVETGGRRITGKVVKIE